MNNKKTKSALVIGGSGDIGQAIVKKLIEKNFKVISTYLNNNKMKSKEINYIKCDVLDDKSIKNLVSIINKQFNEIDVIIFSVSPKIQNKKIFDIKWDEIEIHFRTQVMSIFKLIKSLKSQFYKKYKTKIIVLSTEYCIGKPPKGLTHYILSKYAALGLSKSLAVELAEYNSTVNIVMPGMVDTKLLDNLPPKLIELTAYNNPLKRIATVNDVASLVSFLSSEESDYLNGAIIPINGGSVLI